MAINKNQLVGAYYCISVLEGIGGRDKFKGAFEREKRCTTNNQL